MKKLKASTLRALALWAVLLLVVLGGVFKAGTGSLSMFGFKTISAICPLGSLEALVASKTFIPHAVISLAVILLAAVLLGRIFCAWICPVSVMRKWFPGRKKSVGDGGVAGGGSAGTVVSSRGAAAGGTVAESAETDAAAETEDDIRRSNPYPAGRVSNVKVDSRHWILGGALVSTAIFGFPVFCLICPVGLTFATIAAFWRLFDLNEPSWSLLIFPAIIILELVVFRKWCRKICPLGALMSLMSSLNIFNRPKVDESKCLRTAKGIDCTACKQACFEEIDLHHAAASEPIGECTKCRECSDVCPVHAISFPFLGKKKAAPEAASEE